MDETVLTILTSITVTLFLIFIIAPYWKICSKAGFSRWLSLLIIIPVINMIVIYVIAFSKWPALNKKDNE